MSGPRVVMASRMLTALLDDSNAMVILDVVHLSKKNCLSILEEARDNQLNTKVCLVKFSRLLIENLHLTKDVVPLLPDVQIGDGLQHDVLGDIVKLGLTFKD